MRRPATLVIVALLVVAACSGDDQATPSTTTTASSTTAACTPPEDQRDLPYADDADPLQQLDLYRPADAGCAAVPIVVWVHGGGWQTGDKGNRMDDKIRLWNDAGWAVASVNYRLTVADDPPSTRLMAPAHNEDVATAVGYLVDHADDLGIDPDRVALLGHSAGAGIVAALAADPTYLAATGLDPEDLACVAPLDTEGFDIATLIEGGGVTEQLYRTVFGEDPAGWRQLSPLTHVGEGHTPSMFLVTRGLPDRRAQVAAFADALREAGGDVTVVDLPGFTHEDVNVRIGAADDDVLTPALQDFLGDCLAA